MSTTDELPKPKRARVAHEAWRDVSNRYDALIAAEPLYETPAAERLAEELRGFAIDLCDSMRVHEVYRARALSMGVKP